jgi:hypothetical protein
MAWYNFWKDDDKLDEEIKAFASKGNKLLTPTQTRTKTGEGFEDIQLIQGYGNIGISSFNMFYDRYINRSYETELIRINEYRQMAEMAEIADVIEDAVNESIQEDENGDILTLDIIDEELSNNENIVNNLQKEFYNLFMNNIKIDKKLWDLMRTYFIDGRVFYERIIDTSNHKRGIIGIKKLPTESMDYIINPMNGDVVNFFQYIGERPRRPSNIEEARMSKDIIVFDPNQVGFVNYGVYGKNKYEILGYLDKARIPYNQLKLLETSVIIYRIVRAPERLVFRIDTGSMPMDRAMKFVESVKNRMTKKQTYDANTGELSQKPDVLSILDNYYLPQCLRMSTKIDLLDGRSLTLKDIIEEHQNGIKHEVYSVRQDSGEIIKGEVEWAGVTRKNAELLRIWLDNDEYIDCTPDHKFLVWTDSTKRVMTEIEAQYLTEEMDLVEL